MTLFLVFHYEFSILTLTCSYLFIGTPLPHQLHSLETNLIALSSASPDHSLSYCNLLVGSCVPSNNSNNSVWAGSPQFFSEDHLNPFSESNSILLCHLLTCRSTSYKASHRHHTLLRSRNGNRNKEMEYPLDKDKIRYQHPESSQ